jgi:hypothetical protein
MAPAIDVILTHVGIQAQCRILYRVTYTLISFSAEGAALD